MIGLLFVRTLSRRPVILVPGTYASMLHMKTDEFNYKWYCPKAVDDTVWLNDKFVIPPMFNCLMKWFELKFDDSCQCAQDLPGTSFDTIDFGGLSGITNVDEFEFMGNFSFIPYYKKMIQEFEKLGYAEGVDLFGAPADWRRGIAHQEVFNGRLKDLVEKVYEQSGNQKVAFVGHSFGCYLTQYFLAEYVTQSWVDKYVEKNIMIAPSFGGAGKAVEIGWTKSYEKYIHWTCEGFEELVESLGAIHVHFPNYVLYDDMKVIYGPEGEGYSADQIPGLFLKYGRISQDNYRLMQLQQPYLSRVVPAPRCKSIIYYNNKISTPIILNITDWNSPLKSKTTDAGGDSTVVAHGVERFCKIYPQVECNNIDDSSKEGKHFAMIKNEKYIKQFIQSTQ